MVESLFQGDNYVAAKKLLDVAALRHQAHATNIAHANTPGFRRVEIPDDFQQELRRLMESGDRNGIAALELPKLRPAPAGPAAKVQLDQELMQLSENNLQHQTLTQFVGGSLRTMRSAITGRSQS